MGTYIYSATTHSPILTKVVMCFICLRSISTSVYKQTYTNHLNKVSWADLTILVIWVKDCLTKKHITRYEKVVFWTLSWLGLSKKHSIQYGWLLLPLVAPLSLELEVKPCCWRLRIYQILGPETPKL